MLHEEAHARPPLAIERSEGEVWHWVLLIDENSGPWPVSIDPTRRHQLLDCETGVLRFERHTEFFALTWAGEAGPDDAAQELIASCPGAQFAGAKVIFATDDSTTAEHFGEHRIFGGGAMFDGVNIATDFMLGESGLVSYVVTGCFDDPFARGRLAKRLLDIETYRMAALLALPLVQSRMNELQVLELQSGKVLRELTITNESQTKKIVTQLSDILGELGKLHESMRFRLAASRAYYDLVSDRLLSLNERPLGQRQTLKGFIEHRLSPAMKTAAAFERRLSDLASQVANSLALARTRLDVTMEMQNQSLLKSMNERARQQVRLSQAVEGLSTAAITYYAIGLLAYLLKGVPDFAVADAQIVAAAIPVTLFAVWRGTSQATRSIFGKAQS